jgi:hypothetical protein
LLQPEEAAAVFTDWTRRQRWFARLMLAQLGFTLGAVSADQGAPLLNSPFVAFRPFAMTEPAHRTTDTLGGLVT